jgi:hypothetical protein
MGHALFQEVIDNRSFMPLGNNAQHSGCGILPNCGGFYGIYRKIASTDPKICSQFFTSALAFRKIVSNLKHVLHVTRRFFTFVE